MSADDGLPAGPRALAFASVALTTFVAVLDGSVANVILPPLTQEFGIEPADAIWVVNAYQIAVTVVLLPLATLGEISGFRKVYLAGLVLFTLASAACALSSSLPALIIARALQGLGAAGIMSINIALVRFIYPRAMLGRGVGNVAVTVAVASAAGPTVGGAILAVAPWQAVFLLNLPIGLLALLLGWRSLPPSPRADRRLDLPSVLLCAATFGLVIAGVNSLGSSDRPGLALAQIAAGLALAPLFVRQQLRLPVPMLPVDLLRKPVLALTATTSVCAFAAQSIALVALPFYLHDDLGLGVAGTGLLLTPLPLATAIAAAVSGRMADRVKQIGRLASGGLVLFAGGLLALALLPSAPSTADLLWRLVLTGLGFGLFQAPNNKLLISSAPRERSGGASAIQSTGRLVGQSLGVAGTAVAFGLVAAHPTQVALALGALLAAMAILPSVLRRPE
jgi:MFS transporter, DHA2 family, multidrug resistance protein